MNRGRINAFAVIVLMVGLSGCMLSDQSEDPTSVTTTEEGGAVEIELTWQKAKAQSQTMEQEIAKLIPEEKMVKIDQKATGILFECGEAQHRWKGSTTVTLTEGTEPEPLVKEIEAHYQDSRFKIKTSTSVTGNYRIQLRSPDTSENYIIVKDGPGEVRIASGSDCFTLSEDVYPGGDF